MIRQKKENVCLQAYSQRVSLQSSIVATFLAQYCTSLCQVRSSLLMAGTGITQRLIDISPPLWVGASGNKRCSQQFGWKSNLSMSMYFLADILNQWSLHFIWPGPGDWTKHGKDLQILECSRIFAHLCPQCSLWNSVGADCPCNKTGFLLQWPRRIDS